MPSCLTHEPGTRGGAFQLAMATLFFFIFVYIVRDPCFAAVLPPPDQPKVYHLLSLIHLRQKNYQATVADLDAYIKLVPNSPDGQTAKQIRADTERKVDSSHP